MKHFRKKLAILGFSSWFQAPLLRQTQDSKQFFIQLISLCLPQYYREPPPGTPALEDSWTEDLAVNLSWITVTYCYALKPHES